MSDAERARTIRLPEWLWDEIDRDSVRCRRSSVKQLEAVLAAYYREDASGLDLGKLGQLSGRAIATQSKKPIPHIEKTHTKAKRKA